MKWDMARRKARLRGHCGIRFSPPTSFIALSLVHGQNHMHTAPCIGAPTGTNAKNSASIPQVCCSQTQQQDTVLHIHTHIQTAAAVQYAQYSTHIRTVHTCGCVPRASVGRRRAAVPTRTASEPQDSDAAPVPSPDTGFLSTAHRKELTSSKALKLQLASVRVVNRTSACPLPTPILWPHYTANPSRRQAGVRCGRAATGPVTKAVNANAGALPCLRGTAVPTFSPHPPPPPPPHPASPRVSRLAPVTAVARHPRPLPPTLDRRGRCSGRRGKKKKKN